jgi:hypothetical protein
MYFYLEWSIWPDAISDSWSEAASCQCLWRASSGCLLTMQPSCQGFSLVKRADLWLWPSDKATVLPMGKSKLTETKKTRQATSRGLFTKISSWQAKQPVPHTTVTFCDDCVKICLDFGNKRAAVSLQHCTTPPFLFHQGIFDLKQLDCCPPPMLLAWLSPLWFFAFSLFEDITILAHLRWSRKNYKQCWTLSQKITSHMHLKNDRSARNGCITQKGIILRLVVATRLKVSFWRDGRISPKIMDESITS